jgi:hypothetical protein
MFKIFHKNKFQWHQGDNVCVILAILYGLLDIQGRDTVSHRHFINCVDSTYFTTRVEVLE